MKRACLRLAKAAAMLLALSAPAHADFSSCVASLRADASRAGVPATTLDAAFGGLQPDLKVLDFQKDQPEFKTPVWDYLATLVDEERVTDGKARMAEQASALATAEQRYGVNRYVIAAVWGVESDFGRSMGKRPLVQSLSTLACLGERASYFRGELMATLKIIANGDVPADRLNGSWAGAFGQTQFMPSTFLRLAVDLDGDGRRDIVDSAADALGSTANYLRKSGWRPGAPWGFEVKLPAGYSGPSGRRNKAPMSTWAARGLTRIDGRPLGEGEAGLLAPAGLNGPVFLVTSNFDAIYSYNASESYALAIASLSDRLAGGRPFATPWPTDDPGLSRAERRELQKLLNARGYDVGEPDGSVGKKTKDAIADFESKNGLERDGRPSAKVLAALRR
ncbi:lytic murein transglycosylase [Methylocapsa sp. S129]|uniref:lytic murein transglycosylase n=1 Tax=Methylocapsa sp. S129 TaxID=1641869 RepID=UPI00131C586D|nr:lytic murein transglycosylase [Methylocapsa sp. S129]